MRRRLMFAVDLIPLELDEAVRSFFKLSVDAAARQKFID